MAQIHHASLRVGDAEINYVAAGEGPLVLLLHGTYWSRVWYPVLRRSPRTGCMSSPSICPGAGVPAAN